MKPKRIVFLALTLVLMFSACREDINDQNPTSAFLDYPDYFPAPIIPSDNPLTEEGIYLGRKLFYETQLSDNNTISCASCHAPEHGFSDPAQFSVGTEGQIGTRQSMALVNLAWQTRYFWDGRVMTLEDQVFAPITDPLEMNTTWAEVVERLQNHPEYPTLFEETFGSSDIDSVNVSKAIAQFLRTLISKDSKFDAFYKHENGYQLTADELVKKDFTLQEMDGFDIFMTERGDCFHCHNLPMGQTNVMSNNALDAAFNDPGFMGVTGSPLDEGKFKAPSLRNIALTAPYMHDGRFNTLFEVLVHYNSGLQYSATVDPNMKKIHDGGLNLTLDELQNLRAFLLTLTDSTMITNPSFQDPN